MSGYEQAGMTVLICILNSKGNIYYQNKTNVDEE